MLPFGKVKESHLRNFINEWNIDQCDWMGISVNTTSYHANQNNIQMEGIYKDQQNMIQWAQGQSENDYSIGLIKNRKKIKESKVKTSDLNTFSNVMAGVLHLHMLRSREQIISWARNLDINEYSLPQGEEKILEWIKVSFVILKKAIEEATQDEEATVQMMLFSGIRSDNSNNSYRFKLRIYNLDIEIIETKTLPQITVYDKKSAPEFLPEHQVLKGAMRTLLNPILDEIIQLLPLLEVLTKKKVIA